MAKSKKILYLVTQSEWGGAQKYIFDLATNLVADFEIVVSAGEGDGELFQKLEQQNIRTVRLQNLKRAINPFFDFMALLKLKKLIKKEKPDIIHLNSSKISILGSLAYRFIIRDTRYKIQDTRLIYTVHGWVFNEPLPSWKKWLYLILEKFTAKFKDKIICVSEYDKQVALENKICPAEQLVTIHNGIDLNNIQFLNKDEAKEKLFNFISNNDTRYTIRPPASLREALRAGDTRYTIVGTIANLYQTKGLNYLIEAAKLVTKNHPQTLFIVIGQGPERNSLKEQIKKAGLEKSFFLLGNIKEGWNYLKAFDIFVLPSIKEGFPYTVLESLAAKLPIIATKVGGVPEIINDGINGLLIEPKNSQKLAVTIERLLDDESLRQQLTSNIDLIQFSLKQMVDKAKELY